MILMIPTIKQTLPRNSILGTTNRPPCVSPPSNGLAFPKTKRPTLPKTRDSLFRDRLVRVSGNLPPQYTITPPPADGGTSPTLKESTAKQQLDTTEFIIRAQMMSFVRDGFRLGSALNGGCQTISRPLSLSSLRGLEAGVFLPPVTSG
ncbi:hypothetical protein TNCV_5113381 [Trichonephila clavipes]|nr:hypothetical protein TNCV_5113381 [Trichonephila clavipes]